MNKIVGYIAAAAGMYVGERLVSIAIDMYKKKQQEKTSKEGGKE